MNKSNKFIPITVLTGFLGAGKTTFLNKVVEQNKDKKFGLIINEFGSVNIDSQLVSKEISKDEIYEITMGCICCVVRTDLIKATKSLIEKNPDLDLIVIETSGLADPVPVAQTYEIDNLDGLVYLDSVITVIDCINYFKHKKNYEILVKQVLAADIILLNKVEDSQQIHEIIQDIINIKPDSYFVENNDRLNTRVIIERNLWTYSELLKRDNPNNKGIKKHHQNLSKSYSHDHTHDKFQSYLFISEKPLSLEKFSIWINESFPKEVIRAKGFIRFYDFLFNTFLFQMVGSSKTLLPFSSNNRDFDLQTTKIVFIGTEINKLELERSLKSILQ